MRSCIFSMRSRSYTSFCLCKGTDFHTASAASAWPGVSSLARPIETSAPGHAPRGRRSFSCRLRARVSFARASLRRLCPSARFGHASRSSRPAADPRRHGRNCKAPRSAGGVGVEAHVFDEPHQSGALRAKLLRQRIMFEPLSREFRAALQNVVDAFQPSGHVLRGLWRKAATRPKLQPVRLHCVPARGALI